ncbi:DUF2442 domain-containing protein [Roseibium sp.]|uniref:DUF2442 domain-containing protein n=1 Tax=Roseibium sp. TaxID=1936156 RepID=UPI0032975829
MIKLVSIEPAGPASLMLLFNDGSHGEWSAAPILARATALTRPLEDPVYFARAFIEAGTLAWPNGLDFSAHSLHRTLQEYGTLIRAGAA